MDGKPLNDDGIAHWRELFTTPRGGWNAFDALACLSSVVPEFPHLLNDIDRYRALLRRIEWAGDGDTCPDCARIWRADGEHATNCELAALIGK